MIYYKIFLWHYKNNYIDLSINKIIVCETLPFYPVRNNAPLEFLTGLTIENHL